VKGKLLIPELEAYLEREAFLPAKKRLPRLRPRPLDSEGEQDCPPKESLRCEIKVGGDGFAVKDAVTGRLISHQQAAFLPLLPDRKPNSRNNSRPFAKQTAPVVPGVKGHSGEDREHLQPIFEVLNKVIHASDELEVGDQLFSLI
jgi:hypothetical protein